MSTINTKLPNGWVTQPVESMPDYGTHGRPAYLDQIISTLVENPGVNFKLYGDSDKGANKRTSSRRSSLISALKRNGYDRGLFTIRTTTDWNGTGEAVLVARYEGQRVAH